MENRIIIILGKTGQGKSTLTKQLVKNEKRLVIIDPKQEYEGTIVETFEDFHDFIIKNDGQPFKVICRYQNSIDHDYTFNLLKNIPNVCLVVEEIQIYVSPYIKDSPFLDLLRYGRHNHIKVIAIARRFSEFSADLTGLAEKVYTFKQTSPLDIQTCKKYGLFNVDKLEKIDYVKFKGIPKEGIHYKLVDL